MKVSKREVERKEGEKKWRVRDERDRERERETEREIQGERDR